MKRGDFETELGPNLSAYVRRDEMGAGARATSGHDTVHSCGSGRDRSVKVLPNLNAGGSWILYCFPGQSCNIKEAPGHG
jgi:hypothetical protein